MSMEFQLSEHAPATLVHCSNMPKPYFRKEQQMYDYAVEMRGYKVLWLHVAPKRMINACLVAS